MRLSILCFFPLCTVTHSRVQPLLRPLAVNSPFEIGLNNVTLIRRRIVAVELRTTNQCSGNSSAREGKRMKIKVASLLTRDMAETRAKVCQVSRHCLPSRARYRALCGSLALLIIAVACGGGNTNPANVMVTVSPAAATITENGQVTLNARVTGLCSGCVPSIDSWIVTENNGEGCTWTTTPPDGPCPGGTIQEAPPGNPSATLQVTYFAPSTPSTYHVEATTYIISNPIVAKTGTSVITVNP